MSDPPAQITNPKGRIVLAKGGLLRNESPLAEDFDILSGTQEVTIPETDAGDDYAFVRKCLFSVLISKS